MGDIDCQFEYGETVSVSISLPEEKIPGFKESLLERTAGRVWVKDEDFL